jgi:cytochrome c6
MRSIVLAGVFAGAIAPAAAADESGRLLFTKGTTPACAVCHTLKDAGAVGAVGPVLDEIQPDVERVMNALRNGIGQMPSYKATLSDAQIEALAKYVAGASRGASAGR